MSAEYRQCPHGFHHHRNVPHSCDGCWCEGEWDREQYGWDHNTDPEEKTVPRRSVVIDTQQETPRPLPRPEPSWWKYVPDIVLRRARTTRTAEHKARVDAWEAADRKATVRYYIPNADITPAKEGLTVTARVLDYDPAMAEFYFPKEAE